MNPSLMTDPLRVFGIIAGRPAGNVVMSVTRGPSSPLLRTPHGTSRRIGAVYRYPSSGVPQQTSARCASSSALIAVRIRDR